jgi:hypothetical protein
MGSDVLSAAAVTRFEVASPFIVATLLVLAGGAVAAIVLWRLGARLSKWVEDQKLQEKLPATFTPDSIEQFSQWTIDCAQVLTGLLAPLVGLVVLHKHTSDGLQTAYLGAFVASLLVFVWFLSRDPSRYGKGWPGIFTPALVVMLVVNVAAGVLAYLIGP